MAGEHGYARYSSPRDPCRCDVCRAAKAAYSRKRRQEARALARKYTDVVLGPGWHGPVPWPVGTTRHYVSGVKHGTVFAYEERGCRCRDCTTARTEKRVAEQKRARARARAAA